MNINIYSRIIANNETDSCIQLSNESNQTVINCSDGSQLKVAKCFTEFDDNQTIYENCIENLINATLNGLNSAFFLFGEPEYDKSYIINGSNSNRGIFYIAVYYLFNKLNADRNMKSSFKVQFSILNVAENVIFDLTKLDNSSIHFDKVKYSETEGLIIEGLSEIDLDSAETAISLFSNIWNSKITSFKSTGTIIIQIKCNVKTFGKEQNNVVSQFSIVYFPENNLDGKSPTQRTQSQDLNGLLQLQILLEKLNKTDDLLEYHGSFILETFLEDKIGGNCVTNILLCVSAQWPTETFGSIFKILNKLAKIQNYPIVNTENARWLINKSRHRVIGPNLRNNFIDEEKSRIPHGSKSSLVEEINFIKSENIRLRDKVEDLQAIILKRNADSLDLKSKDLENHLFIKREEEKLRSSKLIMDLEIRNRQLKEQMETVRFDLLNKILHLEEKLTISEVEKECYKINYKDLETAKEQRSDVLEKFSALQKAFDNLQSQANSMEARNSELNIEYINLSNLEGNFKRKSLQPVSNTPTTQGTRDLKGSNTHQELKILSPISPSKDRNLKLRLGQMQEELQNSRSIAQERLKELSQLSIELIVVKEENQKLESQINYMKRYLNQISQEYQKQIKNYATLKLDGMNSNGNTNTNYKMEISSLLNQYDSVYATKENQLKTSMKDLENRLNALRSWSDKAIIEYILIRDQVKQMDNINIGPDPKDIIASNPTPTETVKLLKKYFDNQESHKTDSSNLMELRQQIKEFGNTTVTDLEIERAQLISRNVELEQELLAAQDYIDYYLKKKLTSRIPRNKNL